MASVLLINAFVSNVGAKPAPVKTSAASHKKQPATKPADNVPATNGRKRATTDNSQPVGKNEPIDKPSRNFSHTLDKKKMTKTPRNAQADKKKETSSQSSGTLPGTLQALLTPPAVLDKAIIAGVDGQLQQQTESRTPGKTVRLVAGDKGSQAASFIAQAPKAPSLVTQAAKAPVTRPDQTVSATSRAINRPAQPIIDQSRIKSDGIAPGNSNKPLAINAQPEKAEDGAEIQVSDKTLVAKELPHEVSSGDRGITIADDKRVMADGPALPSSAKTAASAKSVRTSTPPSDQKTQHGGKESSPEILIDNNKTTDSEQSIGTKGPFAAPGGQSSHSRQAVLIGEESRARVVEEAKGDKVDGNQKNDRGKTELFELPGKDRVQAENLSVKSIAQKTTQPRVQLSAQQPQHRGNPLPNHGSNPDMEGGEQVLVGNNAQPAVPEPSPAAAPFPKIAGNTDSDANVSQQIQESVRSSFGEGNREIVIRLNPPELGKVAIKFAEQADGITGLLQVDKLQTRQQIQQALPEIIQNLQDSGVQIKKLEVVLTNQQQEYTSKDQSSTAGQDSWSGQQSSTDPDSQRNNTTYNEWLTNIDTVTEFNEAQMQLTDSSINMLV